MLSVAMRNSGHAKFFEDWQGQRVIEIAVVEREQGVFLVLGEPVQQGLGADKFVVVAEVVLDKSSELGDRGVIQWVSQTPLDFLLVTEDGVEQERHQRIALIEQLEVGVATAVSVARMTC